MADAKMARRFNINDLPEEALCHILSHVDFTSKYAVQLVCKRWYQLLTYPPQGSGVWGTLPLNLVKLHNRVRSSQLEWLAGRAAGIAGLHIYAGMPAPRMQMGPLACPGMAYGPSDSGCMPFLLSSSRHFSDLVMARIMGILSPWLQHAEVHLSGATFQHPSFSLLTQPQAWLVSALRNIRFESNMTGFDEKFERLCSLTALTKLEVGTLSAIHGVPPGSRSKNTGIVVVPSSIGSLTNLRTLKLDLHIDSAGLPASASALRQLLELEISASQKFDPDVLGTLTSLQALKLKLDKVDIDAPPLLPVDEQCLGGALAHLTRLTRLCLICCSLTSVPSSVVGMRRLEELDLRSNTFRRTALSPKTLPTGQGWWPVGAAAALTSLKTLSLQQCCIHSLPPDFQDLKALQSLVLTRNRLGSDDFAREAHEAAMPVLPQLQSLDVSFNGYRQLPQGLLPLTSLTELRFIAQTPETLPALEPLLQLPRLQKVVLMADGAVWNHASVLQLGAFEAKFIAARQAQAGAAGLPAPSGVAALPQSAARPSLFSKLSTMEEPSPGPGSGRMFDMGFAPAFGAQPHVYHLHEDGGGVVFDDVLDDGAEDEDGEDDMDDEVWDDEQNQWMGPPGWL